ncbi:MAG: HipA family kinase [Sphingobacterium sp.]
MTKNSLEIREVDIIRYIQPFREGGSLPGLVDADDGFSYVIKFRGAGQGKKALIAEFIGGELARFLGLRLPEMVMANLNEGFGRTEPDEEIQDLLKFSIGQNLGVSFLNGAITFDANVNKISAIEASKIVWLDALLMNVDRTVKNTNMLIWHDELWLIDHGAALYFHHTWHTWQEYIEKPFIQIKDHVLLRHAGRIPEIDQQYRELFTREKISQVLRVLPDEWLEDQEQGISAEQAREVYTTFLTRRAEQSNVFVKQIENARKNVI